MTRLLLAAVLVSSAAWSQQTLEPIVQSDGTATVTVAPDTADFYFNFRSTLASTTESLTIALTWETTLKKALTDRKIVASEVSFGDIAVEQARPQQPRAAAYTVSQRARLRFGLASFSNIDGMKKYAALCDALTDLAKVLECDIEGPVYDVADRRPLVRQAVARAMEDAYPSANAMTEAMGGQIYAVQSARILRVRWNDPDDSEPRQPGLRTFTCTVDVRVEYSFSGAQP